jgi:hypothetical protein
MNFIPITVLNQSTMWTSKINCEKKITFGMPCFIISNMYIIPKLD